MDKPAVATKIKTRWNIKTNWPLYAMLVPAVILIFVFNYIPIYGIMIAFQDYSPIRGFMGSPFVGLKWFKVALDNPDFSEIVFNTVYISIMKLIFGTIVTITFALMLNEIRFMGYKRTIQTLVYFPHFLSWVIVGGIFLNLLSREGVVNKILTLFGFESAFFLGNNTWFPITMVATDIWKGFGWGAILYLAALGGINPELYESAALDGASRWRQTWHITLPGIRPTIVLLMTLSLGSILDAGFEQIFIMYNPMVYESGDIIDTYVYRSGLLGGQWSFAAAIGLSKSLIGFLLIVISYRLAYKFTNYRIF